MKNISECGLYYIDDEYKILHYNDAVKEMYPEVEVGQYCYKALACRSDTCSHCPLNSPDKDRSFYNSIRGEWIRAQAAEIELPVLGKCHSITFSRSSDRNDEAASVSEMSAEVIPETERTGMIGGYCEEGFPLYFVNSKMIEMLGYDDYDDFCLGIGGLVANTIHPDDMKQVVEDIGPSYYVGLEYTTTYRMPRKDGTWFWTIDKGHVIKADDGRLAIVSYCTDITESMRAQQRLENQNQLLRRQNRLMEFINDGMPGGYHRCDTTEGYPFRYISTKFLDMLGFTREEIHERFDDKFLNLVHPDDRILLTHTSDAALSSEDVSELNMHYRIITKNGYMQVVDSTRVTEYDGAKFFQGVIIDISKDESGDDRALENVKSALRDALLREQEYRDQLKALQDETLDAISCGVFAYTLPDHKLLVVNNAAKAMIGCGENDDPMQFLRSFLLERVVSEDKTRVSEAQKYLMKTGDTFLQNYKAKVNGKIIYLHSNIKRLESDTGQPYILVTLLDVTEQTALNKTLIKEQKAYREALANGCEFSYFFDLTSGIIHDDIITAHGIDIFKAMGLHVPVTFDEMNKDYMEYGKLEFLDENMRRFFTRDGLIEAFENGTTNVVTEYYSPRSDMFIRTTCLMSRDDDTGHIFASILGNDVTEQRRKEKAQQDALLAANEEMNKRIDATLDGISGGLKIIDIENGYKYDYISEGAARLQGYEVEEFLEKFGSRVTSNIYGDEGEPALAEANRQIAEKGSYSVKYRVAHRDGTIKWVIDRGKYVEDPNTGKKCYYILMQDVTDLEEKNAQVSRMLTMQQHMADSLGNGIFAYTLPEREVLILNQEARRMMNFDDGCDCEYGNWIIENILPEERASVAESVKQLKHPGCVAEYIFHFDTQNGERKAYKCTTKLLSFDDGQPFILSAIADITEQELREKRIDEERRQYRNALVYGSAGFFTVDLTDGVMDRPVLAKNGEDITESLGITIPTTYDRLAAIWFSDDRILTQDSIIETIKSNKKLIKCCKSGTSIIDMEYSVPADNSYYHLIILLYEIDGRTYASFIIHDVTNDRHEEKQRRSIINSLGNIYSALYHFSLTDQSFRVFKAHQYVLDELGEKCSYQEFYNFYISTCVTDEYIAEAADFLDPDKIREALMKEAFVSLEFRHKTLGWCRMTLVAAERDRDGIVTAVVFAGNIIEKQKQAELAQQEALRAACESANIANSAKTNFLANMSHDIRTPMNAIIGMTAIAGTHLDDKERVADCLSKISISSKHLLGLINEVLDMSKIESGKMELQEEEFNLPDLIDNLLTMSKPSVSAKMHELNVSVHNISHEDVIGDSQRIQQVFMNLMNNAIKYTPESGRITLDISEKVTNKPNIGCYEFVFEDNGIGMSEDFIKHIFEPFSRATDDVRVDKIQGTGLGMPITQNIIHMMNGTINVESKLNEGTKITVEIFLRLQNKDDKVPKERFIDLPILVADDDEYSCIYTCDMLAEIGMKGEWVLTGEEAVQKAVEHHEKNDDFFAVILDWKMPGMDGVETTRELRRKIGNSIPIVIISAYDWTDIEFEARAAGANAFISKPLFKSRVIHLFSELLGSDNNTKVSSELDVVANEDFSGKRALLVEDNALNAEIAGEILTMTGLEVEFAVNGQEALNIMSSVDEGYFDVVFMDIQMPIMNGYEAARAIRELPGNYTKSVPILAMTANAFAEDVAAAKNARMNEHIAKPLDFDQLIKALKKWLG